MAGPKRPQDRVSLSKMKSHWRESLNSPVGHQGHGIDSSRNDIRCEVRGKDCDLGHGDVVIAAITSCTNTSNPSVMIAAGLVAKNAFEKGLQIKPWVKPSLAPGSRVVTEYLDASGLTPYLDKLGFNVVGYGCTTCIGNSGPLDEEIESAVDEGGLVVGSVLFRKQKLRREDTSENSGQLPSKPPLVVAYALSGTLDIDFESDPIGHSSDGVPVMLADIWPSDESILEAVSSSIGPEMFRDRYSDILEEPKWDSIPSEPSPYSLGMKIQPTLDYPASWRAYHSIPNQ